MGLSDDAIRRLRTETFGEDTFAGRFELRGEATSGGMSRVFEGVDRETGVRVAIKLLLGGEDRARFAAEAEMLERLDHPGIVKYIRHGENRDGVPYLAMEWLAGETLAARLERGPLSVLAAADLGAQLAAALAYLHGEGIIHRDLKPSNIYLVDGAARLIDLGIAKSAEHDLTRTGQIVGTPGYMAPEQARGDKTADARIDLFALGCVLYESLSGKPPFEGTAVMEVLARLLLHTPPPIEMIVAAVPPRMATLVESLLAKAPGDRLADAGAAFAELDAIRDAIRTGNRGALGGRSAAQNASTVRERPAVVSRPTARRRWPIIAAACAVMATIAGVVIWRRAGADTRCDGGDAGACLAAGEALLDDDKRAAVRAFSRGCELGSVGACVRGVALVDKMRAANELAGSEAAVAQVGLLEAGCRHREVALCFELGKRVTPMLGSLAPDAARAYDLVMKACSGQHRDACSFLETMLEKRIGTSAQHRTAVATYAGACTTKLLACKLGQLGLASAWASEVIVDDDEALRSPLPSVLALSPGKHRVAYLHGARRCSAEIEVVADQHVVHASKVCDATRKTAKTAPGGDQGADRVFRAQAITLGSLEGEYIDPCYPDDKIQFYGRSLEPGGEGDAHRELERYRNIMGCKHIKRQDIPGSSIEDDFHSALARGDSATAKQIAGKLVIFARAFVVDKPFVQRRLAGMDAKFSKHDILANDPKLVAMLVDARAELAAGRFESANLVLNHLGLEVNGILLTGGR